MAEVYLPTPLLPLFPELTKRVEVDVPTVGEAIAQLNERWPGFRDPSSRPGRRSGRTSTSTSTRSGAGSTRRSAKARA